MSSIIPPNHPNRMRWNCEAKGCFNQKMRPKLEVFKECFPVQISFGDIDGLVEIGSRFLVLEWKTPGGTIKAGQHYTFQALRKTGLFTIIVAEGNAETMEVDRVKLYLPGKIVPWFRAGTEDAKRIMSDWAINAERYRRG